ncbi:MAG: hypothetical protein CME13_17585 [Gemmatimonadetes bacterium]|nr:hypothetical protein [Gemmatimonadota bacterium]
MFRFHFLSRTLDQCPFDDVLQLADVSGKVIRLQHRHRRIGPRRWIHPHLLAEEHRELLDQEGHILPPIRQGRHLSHETRQTIVVIQAGRAFPLPSA